MKTAKFSRFLPPRGLPNDSVKSTTVGTLTLWKLVNLFIVYLASPAKYTQA